MRIDNHRSVVILGEDDSELTYYDDAHNDPPLDLREDVEMWVTSNGGRIIPSEWYEIHIQFDTQSQLAHFMSEWEK